LRCVLLRRFFLSARTPERASTTIHSPAIRRWGKRQAGYGVGEPALGANS